MICRDCLELVDEYDTINKICYDCLFKESYSIEIAKQYLKENNLESEFYCEWYVDAKILSESDNLIAICKSAFETDLLYLLEWSKIKAVDELYNYCVEDKEYFVKWINNQKST